jgi:hypothetical protein
MTRSPVQLRLRALDLLLSIRRVPLVTIEQALKMRHALALGSYCSSCHSGCSALAHKQGSSKRWSGRKSQLPQGMVSDQQSRSVVFELQERTYYSRIGMASALRTFKVVVNQHSRTPEVFNSLFKPSWFEAALLDDLDTSGVP